MMTVNHNLGVFETVAMVTILTCAKIFLGLPRHMAELGATAGWLVILISCSHGPLIWLAVRRLLRDYPGKSLVTATEAILGPVFGTVVNLAYFSYFAAICTIVLREFADAESGIFLLRTPLAVLVFTLLGVSMYITSLGMESICRTAALGGPLMLIGLVILLAGGLLTHMEPRALAPYFGTGLLPVVTWGLLKDMLGDLLIIGLLAPAFRRRQDMDKAFLWSSVLCALILTGSTIVISYVFPYPSSARVSLPLLQVSRTISLGPGVQRVESLFFLIWLVGGLLKIAVTGYASAAILAQILRLPSYRHLLPALALLIYSCALLPASSASAATWDTQLRTFGSAVSILLPALTAGITFIRRKRGETSVAG